MIERNHAIKQYIQLAGEVVRKSAPSLGIVQKEGWANILTAADLASEKIIIDNIKLNFPTDQILAEETESSLKDILSIDKLWVIDPIDGTNNFRNERNYSGISIAYVEKGIIKLGTIYNPFSQELFFAERGRGAFLNGRKITIGTQTELSKSAVAIGNSYNPEGTRQNLELLLKINPTPWVLIRGSAVLEMCEVACGKMDLYFHNAHKPWDNAAAFLITEEAGGVVKGFNGEEINFLSPKVIVGNRTLVEQFVEAFR